MPQDLARERKAVDASRAALEALQYDAGALAAAEAESEAAVAAAVAAQGAVDGLSQQLGGAGPHPVCAVRVGKQALAYFHASGFYHAAAAQQRLVAGSPAKPGEADI